MSEVIIETYVENLMQFEFIFKGIRGSPQSIYQTIPRKAISDATRFYWTMALNRFLLSQRKSTAEHDIIKNALTNLTVRT